MIILKVFLTVIHVLVSAVLIVAILLQSSKGGGLAGTFGGQATSSLFGPRGAASALATMTQYLAGGFLILSLVLSLMAGGNIGNESVTQKVLQQTPASQLPPVGDLDFGTNAPATQGAGGSAPANPAPSQGTNP
jgi:preprotein translocase subunit SecG